MIPVEEVKREEGRAEKRNWWHRTDRSILGCVLQKGDFYALKYLCFLAVENDWRRFDIYAAIANMCGPSLQNIYFLRWKSTPSILGW